MKRIRITAAVGSVLALSLACYLLVNPFVEVPAVNAGFAICAGLIVVFAVFTVGLGSLGPLVVRQNLERIGFTNRKGEAPILFWIQAHEEISNGFKLFFENREINREEWEEKRAAIEAALNIFIIKISDGKNRRRIIIDAIPAKHGLPDFIEWRQEYLPSGDFVLRLGEGLCGPIDIDLAIVPHVLIGGATGSGKSLLLRLLLAQCLAKGEGEGTGGVVILGDFKGGLDYLHFKHPSFHLITDMDSFVSMLEESVRELKARIDILSKAGASNLKEYNEKNPLHQHRRIIIACDEVAEALDKTGLSKEAKERIDKANDYLSTIATQGRAVGLHLMLSTQRPDANILTGQVKSNMVCRICGRADLILSQIILNNGDAHDSIPKDAQGRFIMHDGTVFQGYWSDI